MILPPDRRATPTQTPQTPAEFARQVYDQLPLAKASLALFAHALPDAFLTQLFHNHRGRCYQDTVTFPQLVGWLFDALVTHQGSGRQAHLQRQRHDGDAGNEAF